MTLKLKAALYSRLSTAATVGTSLYPALVPEGVSKPFARLTVITDQEGLTHAGADGFITDRVQVDVTAATHDSMATALGEYKTLMHGFTGTVGDVTFWRVKVENTRDGVASGLPDLFTGSLDLMIWYKET